MENKTRLEKIAYHYGEMMRELGCEFDQEEFENTPLRHARFLTSFVEREPIAFTTFPAKGMDEAIIEVGIPFCSLCAHHALPFFGQAAIAYVPNDVIAGLSKLPRTLNYFCSAFQTQENITMQVAQYLEEQLKPKGVAVQLVAAHTCMEIRGVKAHGVKTVTDFFLGCFKTDPASRAEFMAVAKR